MQKTAAEPKIEKKMFSSAELDYLNGIRQKVAQAQIIMDEGNRYMKFLQDQHGITGQKDWQLGDDCFYRPVGEQTPTPIPDAMPEGVSAPTKRKSKQQARIEEVAKVTENGHLPDSDPML